MMRFLLRKISIGLRRLSFLPVGYNRTLSFWNLLSIRTSLYRVCVVWVASSIALAIFGVGLHVLLREFLSPDAVTGWSKIIISSVLVCSSWIFMVSMNHIHDITGLWSDISHYYELIWWIPAYISVTLIGPFFNLFYWVIKGITLGNILSFWDLTLIKEFMDFWMMTVPAFSIYIWENITDLVSENISFEFIRRAGQTIYDSIVYSIATVIWFFSPNWVQDTRIGRWTVLSVSSGILVLATIKVILRLLGW